MKLLTLARNYKLSRLRPYQGNYRAHDLDFLASLLQRHGQHRTIVVRADDPARPQDGATVLAGNGIYFAACELGWATLSASVVEASDAEAQEIVVADNRAQERGGTDHGLLATLLEQINERGALEDVGYDQKYLAGLLDEVRPGLPAEVRP